MADEQTVSIGAPGSRALNDEELTALEDDGKIRREPRLLVCTLCDFTEEFETLFIEQEDGTEEEIPDKGRGIIQEYHRTTKHPDVRSLTWRVRLVEGHPSEQRESAG